MAVGCGANCARIVLIIFNIIFWLSGAALMGVGIWVIVDDDVANRLTILSAISSSGALAGYAAYVLIGVGAFIFMVGFLGCCGALKESQCMLGTYVFLLVIIMLAEIGVAVLGIVFRNEIEEGAGQLFRDNVRDHYGQNDTEASAFWEAVNLVQKEGECCGFDNGTAAYIDQGFALPSTCCADTPATCSIGNAYEKGCKESLLAWVEENSVIIIGVGIGIACIEIFGIIFGICLCRNVED